MPYWGRYNGSGIITQVPDPYSDVLLVAGQSNAIINGLLDTDVPSYLQTPDPGIQIFNGSSFVELVNGTNNSVLCINGTSNQNWGPEAQFSYLYRQTFPGNTLRIIKFAQAATQLAINSGGTDWNPASSGKLFDAMTAYVTAGMSALSGVSPPPFARWLIWMQGEQDSLDNTEANAYGANLAAFISAVQSRWGTSQMNVIIGRISNSSVYTFGAAVRAAQVAAAGPTVSWVNTDNYSRQSDNVHYTGAGAVSFGGDCWNQRIS